MIIKSNAKTMADAIYDVNVDGSLGKSTGREIEYANDTSKQVIYHEEPDQSPINCPDCIGRNMNPVTLAWLHNV